MNELNGQKFVYDKNGGDPGLAGDQYARKENRAEDDMFAEENTGSGDKWGACLPFLGALVEPTNHPPINPAEPTEQYNLEYVYGYRTYDCRQNLYFAAGGNRIIYCVAALGISMDINTNTQLFFGGGTLSKNIKAATDQHDDDIICLAISPDRKLVATGQVGPNPKLFIWDAETGKLKNPKSKFKIPAKNCRAICCCGWSIDSKYVAFVDKSEKRNVYVIEADTGSLVYSDSFGSSDAFDVNWSQQPGSQIFAVCGAKQIKFYDLAAKTGKLGTGHGGQTFSCVTFDDKGVCYAGGIDGEIYIFNGNAMTSKKPMCKGLIHSINWVNGKLLCGCADRSLYVNDTKIGLPSIPRAIDANGDKILVGCRDGTILLVTGGKVEKEYMKSHHDGEIWGLEVLENGDVLTSGDDNKVMVWSSKEKKNKAVGVITDKEPQRIKYGASSMTSYPDNQCSRAICYNPKTKEVAFASNFGEVHIRDLDKLSIDKKMMKACERWIEFMAYSPDGNFLAVGTHNSTIVIYTTDSYTQKGILKGNSSSITSLDWSKNSKYLRTNSESYELLFYTIETMAQDASGASGTKDLEWATQNTKIGWSVIGVFPKGVDGTHVNGVSMSADGKLIATGDDWGLLSIYRNPCREGSQGKAFRYY